MDIAAEARTLFQELHDLTWDEDGVTRPSYGYQETQAMSVVSDYAKVIGLDVSTDAAANVHISLAGREPGPAIYCGSHMDSVPQGGNYDGAAGVIAGLLALRNFVDRGVKPKRSIKLLMLRGEESAWFGKCYLGSLALLGKLSASDLERKESKCTGEIDPQSLASHMKTHGGDPHVVGSGKVLLDPKDVHAFLELHIEQGPVLEAEKIPIGIVTGIRGNVRQNVECRGEAGHSGTTPMEMRRDAVAASASYISELFGMTKTPEWTSDDLVVTIGKIHTDATRDAASVIPDLVKFTMEWRSLSEDTLALFGAWCIRALAFSIEDRYGVKLSFDKPTITKPASMHDKTQTVLASACRNMGIPHKLMPSGAGHDAAVFAAEGIPTGMIFVRNQNGSHNPREAMEMDDFALGVNVLEKSLWEMANE